MKKFLLGVAFFLPLIAFGDTSGIIFGSNDASVDRTVRKFQYYPTADGYIATHNGNNLYTRALYGGHSLWRLETSDRPIFAAYHKKDNRNISFFVGAGKKGALIDLQDAASCTALYRGGQRVYRLSDAAWNGGTLEISVLARHDAEGAVWQIKASKMPKSSRLVAQCGPTVNVKLSRSGDLGADPANAFAPADGPTDALRSCSVDIGGKNATKYVLYDDRNVTADNQTAIADIYSRAERDMNNITSRLQILTPDPYINSLGANLAAAADGIWDGDTYQHGAIGWRMPLAGWRGAYTGDFLGWHDRARNHFNAYAASQVTNVPPIYEHPAQDSTLALARAEKRWGTQMYSNGYICRNPRKNDTMHHYDMNLCYIDELLWHLCWTGDLEYAREIWPTIKLSLEWEKRNFDPDDDGLYDAYCCIWASDALYYSGGGVTHSSAYNYRANKIAADIAKLIGEDPVPYQKEAAKIKTAIEANLWMPDKGVWAEYKDAMGLKRLHDHPAVWTVYHAIDSDVASPLQYYAATRYIDDYIPHFNITAQGDSIDTQGAAVVSTTDWMPYSWSINNVAHAETLNTALAYWQARRNDDAYKIFKGMILDGMYLGASPGNIGQISHYDAARGESYRDFADPVGVMSRALVQGLFGYQPDLLNRRVTVTPGFPSSWDSASITHPDFDLSFVRDRENETDTYYIDVKQPGAEHIRLVFPSIYAIETVTVDDKNANIEYDSNSVGHSLSYVDIEGSGKHSVCVQWFDDASEKGYILPTGRSIPGYEQVSEDGKLWWREIQRDKPRTESTDYGLDLMVASGNSYESLPLENYYNALVTDIFRNEYLSPRPKTTTLRIPVQGIGEWCHPLDSATIDDSGFRSKLISDIFITPQGIPFRSASKGKNVVYTSLFDNYPDSVTIPLNGKAYGLELLLVGSTNHMQCHVENGVIKAEYNDGTTITLPLIPPHNWCPIEQDYYIDNHAFKVVAENPWRICLGNGIVSNNLGKELDINEVYGRRIPGGAATMLCMPLDPNKELKSLTIKTLSNDIVIGLMSASYLRSHTPAPMSDVNNVIDNTPDSLDVALTVRPVPGSTRRGDNPVLFLVGNSTMRTGTKGNGNNGQWGWGYFMHEYFDNDRITVENHALGGMSSRTFYNRLWPEIVPAIRKGDYVIIELGHNDNGPYDSGRARASIPGIGSDSLNVTIQETGERETVYSYGEYMRRFVKDVKRQGGIPILMSLTPRNAWDDTDSTIITRVKETYGKWAKEVAEAESVPFIDLNEITATKYETFGKEKVKYMFYLDRIHTSAFGARVNAESAVEGIWECNMLKDLQSMITPIGEQIYPRKGPKTFIANESDGYYDGYSARTFVTSGPWDKIYRALEPGDTVKIHFDYVDLNADQERGMLDGTESRVININNTGRYEVVYPYSWYINKIANDTREKGAFPIILPSDSVLVSDKGFWHTIETLPGGGYVTTAKYDDLCGAPQSLTVAYIPAKSKYKIGIAVSDTVTAISKFAGSVKALLAVNGSYFDMERDTRGRDNSVCFLKTGSVVRDTTSMTSGAANAALKLAQKPSIISWNKSVEKSYTDTVGDIIVSGPVLLAGGNYCLLENMPQKFAFGRHPRTAAGITASGDLLLVVADGRHINDAAGLTLPQLAWIMKQLGAVDAINLDGGGSSAMWTRKNGIVTHPSGNFEFDRFGDRPIPNIIYISE